MERVLRCFFCVVSGLVLTAYLKSSRGDVLSFARQNFIFCVICTVFCVISSGGVFRLRLTASNLGICQGFLHQSY